MGDEFPVQLCANHGFAVLSVQRPAPAGSIGGATDAIDLDRRSLIGFADRRNVLSVIEKGVDTLVARGIVDPGSVGITGLSDGSSTVQFASLNSSRSEEHTSELQSLMRISYAVFCLKKKKK